jgi:hypothetical protein
VVWTWNASRWSIITSGSSEHRSLTMLRLAEFIPPFSSSMMRACSPIILVFAKSSSRSLYSDFLLTSSYILTLFNSSDSYYAAYADNSTDVLPVDVFGVIRSRIGDELDRFTRLEVFGPLPREGGLHRSPFFLCRGPTVTRLIFGRGPSDGICEKGGSRLLLYIISRRISQYTFRFLFQIGFVVTWRSFLSHYSIRIRSCLANFPFYCSISNVDV